MPYRYTNLRIENHRASNQFPTNFPLSLWRVAIAAAEETIQGGPLTSAWLNLFQSHLSQSRKDYLCWRKDLAESTEMRRAYSAMYGRYFSRALLSSVFQITDFVPIQGDRTVIGGGVEVRRVENGDMPDWIAWDPIAGYYVLVEAKGNLTGGNRAFLHNEPKCIRMGMDQFSRVSVKHGVRQSIPTLNWVVANLWATDDRTNKSVSLLWHQVKKDFDSSSQQVAQYAASIREHRIKKLAALFDREERSDDSKELSGPVIHLSIKTKDDPLPTVVAEEQATIPDTEEAGLYIPIEEEFRSTHEVETSRTIAETPEPEQQVPLEQPAKEPHQGKYLVSIVTPLGIRPINDKADFDAALSIQDRVRETDEPILVYGLSTNAMATFERRPTSWVSGNGIVTSDGAGLFDIRDAELNWT